MAPNAKRAALWLVPTALWLVALAVSASAFQRLRFTDPPLLAAIPAVVFCGLVSGGVVTHRRLRLPLGWLALFVGALAAMVALVGVLVVVQWLGHMHG